MKNENEQSIWILDTETTGLSGKTNAACEIAIQQWYPQSSQPFEWSTLINPGFAIPSSATEIHGITNEDVKNAPTTQQAFQKIYEIIPENSTVLAYNMKFDQQFIDLKERNVGCVFHLAKKIFKDAPNHKLGGLAQHLNIELKDTMHRAMADVKITSKILDIIYEKFANLEDLLTQSKIKKIAYQNPTLPIATNYDIMTFGKYKGYPIAILPLDYIDWVLLNCTKMNMGLRLALQEIYDSKTS